MSHALDSISYLYKEESSFGHLRKVTQTDNIEQPGYRGLLEDCGRILHARRTSANKSRGHREDKAAMVDLYLDLDISKQRVLYYFMIGDCGEVIWCGETPKLVFPPSRSIGKFINATYLITQSS